MRAKASGLRLPVETFLIGAPDGTLMILVGACMLPITSDDLGLILASGGELPQGRPKLRGRAKSGRAGGLARAAKAKKSSNASSCFRCGKAVVSGQKVCRRHLKIIRAAQAKGVANRKAAAS